MNKDTETILRIICPHYEDGKCGCNVHQSRERDCTGNCHYGMIAEELIENGVFVRPCGTWYVEQLHVPDDAKNKNMERYRVVCPFCGRRNGKKQDKYCPECGSRLKKGKRA